MAGSHFQYAIYIRTTPEELWYALTAPAFTRQYWAETWHDCQWHVGASWKLMTPDGRIGDAGEVVEIDPPRRLVVSWQNQFMPELKVEGHSRATFELEPVGESVKLTITHEIDRPDSKLIAGVSTGWPHILSSLKSLLETGKPLVETTKWPEGV